MKQVQADSQGKTKMGPGTLYGSMGRMMEAGLIREMESASILRWTTSGGSITNSRAQGGQR